MKNEELFGNASVRGKTPATARVAEVKSVLKAADRPLGPTEIARRINQPWCVKGYPLSSAILPILRQIGAVRSGSGQYSLPSDREVQGDGEERYKPYYMMGRGAA